jgi:phosphoglycolate phosphatase
VSKLFIFDWDGTLIDSANKIVGAMRAGIEEVQLPTRTDDEIRNIIGLGLPEAILHLFPDLSAAEQQLLRAAYAKHFVEADQRQPCELFPQVLTTLQQLREQGCLLAVATGKNRRGLTRVLSGLGLEQFFDATRCADETRSKPHPQMLHELLAELSMPAEQAVMIGDTEYDMAMARNADMPRIAVNYGAHAAERLLPYQPELVMAQFDELLDWRARRLANQG